MTNNDSEIPDYQRKMHTKSTATTVDRTADHLDMNPQGFMQIEATEDP